jgi:hypothetical protein
MGTENGVLVILLQAGDLTPWTLHPAEVLQRQTGVPDLSHVDDLVVFKLHYIDVIGADAPSSWWDRPALSCVGTMKHSVSRNVVSHRIRCERLYFVMRVRKNRQDSLHPVRIVRERLHIEQWFGLRSKGGVRRAVLAANVPPFFPSRMLRRTLPRPS